MKRLILPGVIALTLLGCGKENIEDHPKFIGFWESRDYDVQYTMEIKSNNKAEYQEVDGNATFSANGRFKLKPDEYVQIHIKKFDLDQYPADSGGYRVMVLEGIKYYAD